MEIEVVQSDVTEIEVDVLVVNLFEGVTSPGGATGAVDSALGGVISELISDGEISGSASEFTLIHTPNSAFPSFKPARVLVAGLGSSDSFDTDVSRRVSAAANKIAGNKFEMRPKIIICFHFRRNTDFRYFRAKGKSSINVKETRIVPTCNAEKTSSPRLINIKELPQINERNNNRIIG